MTFTFGTIDALIFFGAYIAVLWIVLNGMSTKAEPEWCPLHPHSKTCAHRKRKE